MVDTFDYFRGKMQKFDITELIIAFLKILLAAKIWK